MRGLPCFAQAFFSCGEWGRLFIMVLGVLIAVASLAVENRLWGTRAQWLWLSCWNLTWNLPGPCIEFVFAALAGEFLCSAPLGNSFLPFKGWIIFHGGDITHFGNSKRLDCFHVLAIVNDTAVNMGAQIFLRDLAFSSFGWNCWVVW